MVSRAVRSTHIIPPPPAYFLTPQNNKQTNIKLHLPAVRHRDGILQKRKNDGPRPASHGRPCPSVGYVHVRCCLRDSSSRARVRSAMTSQPAYYGAHKVCTTVGPVISHYLADETHATNRFRAAGARRHLGGPASAILFADGLFRFGSPQGWPGLVVLFAITRL